MGSMLVIVGCALTGLMAVPLAVLLLVRAGRKTLRGPVTLLELALLAVGAVGVALVSAGGIVAGLHETDPLAAAVQHRYGVTLVSGPTGAGTVTVRKAGGATLPCFLSGPDTAPVLRCVTAELPRISR